MFIKKIIYQIPKDISTFIHFGERLKYLKVIYLEVTEPRSLFC